MCRRIAGVFLVLLFLAAAGVGYVAYNVFHTPGGRSAAAPISPVPSPLEQQSAEQTIDRLSQQVRRAGPGPGTGDIADGTERPQPARSPVELRVTQQEANSLLTGLPQVRKTLAAQKLSAPQISFEPDRIVASVQVPVYRGMRARVSAVGRVWAENGHLAYETEDVYLGDIPAPARVRRELDRTLRDAVRNLNREIEGKLEEARVANGELVLRVRS